MKRVVVVLSIAVALTRLLAIAQSLWDWDEALFALAVRDYDVTLHHPHPPGFPLFIALAKLIPIADEFRALQTIVVFSSLFIFPAMLLLAREMGAPPFVAIAAALLLAFTPNVWFFGGTALSDVPSMVLTITACALLLRGRRDTRALLAGAIVLGIAAGMRPQSLLIAFVPFVLAFRARKRETLLGAVIVALIVAVSFGAAAHFSGGWTKYRAAVTAHETWIRAHDSFLASVRPPLWKVADDFFFWPYRAPVINIAFALLIAIAFVKRRGLLAIATFGPFVVFAWLYLDFHSSSRFAVAYMPLYALLAAYGIDALRRARHVALALLLAMMVVFTWPALRVVRTTDSPPVAAMRWLEANTRGPVAVDAKLVAHAKLLLPDRVGEGGVRVVEGDVPGALVFRRERARIARALTRPRYFEVSVRHPER